MGGEIDAAGESIVLGRAFAALQPGQKSRSRWLQDLKLNGSPRISLHNKSAIPDLRTTDEVANADPDEITSAQLAVDRQIEQRTVTHTSLLFEPESDRPYLLLLERSLRADLPPRVPCCRRVTVKG